MLRRQPWKQGTLLAGSALVAVAFLLPPDLPGGSQRSALASVDYANARREIENFELVINDTINTVFSSSPFALVQKPKGVYLQGYGVTFTFLINIHRAVIETPFGKMRGPNAITPELKKRRIEELKEKLIRMLLDKGDSFHAISDEEAVTIVAFFEDRNFPDEPSENKTIVMTALKKDLAELAHKTDRWNDFKQRVKIVEY